MSVRSRLLALLLALACGTSATPSRALEPVPGIPSGVPADSIVRTLRRIEATSTRPVAGAAAFELGGFHHVRGEYRAAAEAFGRAAARLQDYDHSLARYRQGLAWLGEGEAGRARAAFEEVAGNSRPLRAEALQGWAQTHALLGETAAEMEVLRRLLAGSAGEVEPAALARWAVLCELAGNTTEAASARDRIRRRWPRSLEAARLGGPAALVKP